MRRSARPARLADGATVPPSRAERSDGTGSNSDTAGGAAGVGRHGKHDDGCRLLRHAGPGPPRRASRDGPRHGPTAAWLPSNNAPLRPHRIGPPSFNRSERPSYKARWRACVASPASLTATNDTGARVLSHHRSRRGAPQPLSPKGAQSTWACVANGAGLDMDAPMMLRPCNCRPGTPVRARRAALGSAPTSAAFAARVPSARAQRSIFVAVLALPRRSHLRIESADQAARSRRGVCADGSALCQARSSHRLTAREA